MINKHLVPFLELESYRSLEKKGPTEVPKISMNALKVGLETPTLLLVASESFITAWRDIEDQWKQLLKELSLRKLTRSEAVHYLTLPKAQKLAKKCANKEMGPMETIGELDKLSLAFERPNYLHFTPQWELYTYYYHEGDHKVCAKIEKEARQYITDLLKLTPFELSGNATDPILYQQTLIRD